MRSNRRRIFLGGLAVLLAALVVVKFLVPFRDRVHSRSPLERSSTLATPETTKSTPERSAVVGSVLDDEYRPVRGASVKAFHVDYPETSNPVLVLLAQTDADGRFRLAPLTTGYFLIAAEAPGYVPATSSVVSVEQGSAAPEVLLQLGRSGSNVQGRVTDWGGIPIPSAKVSFLAGGEGRALYVANADKEGHYSIRLRDGDYGAIADADGYGLQEHVASVHGNTSLDFRLSPGAIVAGRLKATDPLARLDTAKLFAELLAPSHRRFQGDVTPDGSFEVRNLPPGQFSVAATLGALFARSSGVALAAGERVDIGELRFLNGAEVSGTVTDKPEGAPVSATLVALEPAISRPQGAIPASVLTRENGTFIMRGVAPGAYLMRAHRDGYAPWSRSVTIDGDLRGLRIELAAGATVAGKVLDDSGAPVGGADVRVEAIGNANSAFATNLTTIARSDGTFRVTGVPPGAATVRVVHPIRGRGGARVGELRAGEVREVAIKLEAASWVSGVVRYSDDQVASNVSVGGTMIMMPPVILETRTDSSGRYQLGPYPAGRLALMVGLEHALNTSREGQPGDVKIVDLGFNEQKRGVDLLLERPVGTIEGAVLTEDRQPVGGARVGAVEEIRLTNGGTPERMTAGDHIVSTADDGSFKVERLSTGPWRLWTGVPGRPRAELRQVQAPSSGVVLQLRKGGKIEGTVNSSKGAVQSFTARAEIASLNNRESGRVVPEIGGDDFGGTPFENGTFSLGGLLPGTYVVVARAPQGLVGRSSPVSLEDGATERVSVTLSRGIVVKGTLLDFDTSRPLPGSFAMLKSASNELLVTVDDSGSFTLDGVLPDSDIYLTAGSQDSNFLPHIEKFSASQVGSEIVVGEITLVRKADGAAPLQNLGFRCVLRDHRLFIGGVSPDGYAARAGLRPNDEIAAIGGKSVKGLDQQSADYVLARSSSQPLELTVVSPGSKPRTVELSTNAAK